MIRKFISILSLLLITLVLPTVSMAVDIAPRISDREIIEKLAKLEAGQVAINQRFEGVNQRFDGVNQRFDGIDQRFDGIDQRFDDINQRFDDMNQRFDDMNQRMSAQQSTMLALFSSMIALILALFAYIAWDRRTMLKPVAERLDKLEKNLNHDLDLAHPDGSKITRLLKVLRNLAKHDENVADALRSCSLL